MSVSHDHRLTSVPSHSLDTKTRAEEQGQTGAMLNKTVLARCWGEGTQSVIQRFSMWLVQVRKVGWVH